MRLCKYTIKILIFLILFQLLHISQPIQAKTRPWGKTSRAWLFKRAASLDNGMNISWLEQTWKRDFLNDSTITDADFMLLKKLGFKSIRLPVAFKYFENKGIPLNDVLLRITDVLKECKKYNMTLIIDYHAGELKNDNYLTETPKIINLWQKVAKNYLNESPDKLFFEIYNEPTISDAIWKDAAYNIVEGIRKVDKKRTLLVGASNYNSIYELSRMVRLGDENIIYSIHFYEPFFFTHQGAEWIGNQASTVGVAFPYSVENFPILNPKTKNTWGETNYYKYRNDGNEQSLTDKLRKYISPWIEKYDVPVVCTEFGAYNKYADLPSRCRYIKAARKTLKTLKIPGMIWEYNDNFSIFDGKPSEVNLPDCMKEAIDYHK
ncbi:glycoside hydrolase family 5 protein [Mucilaginibacter sp. HMF5004]|uniref:glycoside hydrolase family 5 protein n=1 Tax=Mucilaginibacter rivuli TaxID=2857527 RepID=UPI001C5F3061|nr:cellulase family glycosylhydrolase [Mucilaginibacter rivuli]MBW4890894.1 glycoside hydrolase family 5 protein [Mucilaginibacter rivuli]